MSTLRDAWKTVTEGTTRTLKWVAGGMRNGSKDDAPQATTPAPAVQAADPEKSYGDRLADRFGHSPRTIGLAIGVGLIVALWIGWTAYVWAENGSTAGIGVLISWPAVLAAVMLVTAPFIGGAVAVRRHRAEEPVLAGAIAPAEPAVAATPEAEAQETEETKPEAKAEADDNTDDDDGTDEDEGTEDEDEEQASEDEEQAST